VITIPVAVCVPPILRQRLSHGKTGNARHQCRTDE
jgi:hypothetical protein